MLVRNTKHLLHPWSSRFSQSYMWASGTGSRGAGSRGPAHASTCSCHLYNALQRDPPQPTTSSYPCGFAIKQHIWCKAEQNETRGDGGAAKALHRAQGSSETCPQWGWSSFAISISQLHPVVVCRSCHLLPLLSCLFVPLPCYLTAG